MYKHYGTERAARAAVRKAGLHVLTFIVCKFGGGPDFPGGSFSPVFCHPEKEDREYIRSKGFRAVSNLNGVKNGERWG